MKNKHKQKKTVHRITFESDVDLQVCVRGSLGQHTRAIAKFTGLTESQVAYRLKKANVSRRAYRDGESEEAQYVFDITSQHLYGHWHNELVPRFKKT
jgi:hypothetical protein